MRVAASNTLADVDALPASSEALAVLSDALRFHAFAAFVVRQHLHAILN